MSERADTMARMEVGHTFDEHGFTDFHTHSPGRLDLRVFDQSTWWVDRNATPHLLVEMSDQYLASVLAWVVEHQADYYFAVLRRRAIELLCQIPLTPVAGSTVEIPATAEEWLDSTTLYRYLKRVAK